MASRTNDLSLEQLDELVALLDQNIESMNRLKDLEQQMTHARHPDVRLTAMVHSMELQRTGYNALRSRKSIIGR